MPRNNTQNPSVSGAGGTAQEVVSHFVRLMSKQDDDNLNSFCKKKGAARGAIVSLVTSGKHFAAGFWVLGSAKLAVFTNGCPHPYVKTVPVCDYI